MALQKVVHPECKKTGFYVRGFPIRRPLEYYDALNEYEQPLAMGQRVECVSCEKKLDFKTINDYYEVES